VKRTKRIVIHHAVEVDACIADEVEELNNRYGIVTEWSCCGHGDRTLASISVKTNGRDKMYALRYETVGKNAWQDCIFRPKSVCHCKATQKCSRCGKVRRGWSAKPFLCYDCNFKDMSKKRREKWGK
jgi:hypothetical protein